MKKHKRMPSKIISAVMAFLFITLSIPFAFAADVIALSSGNVTEWPTATANGEAIYFGQKVGDAMTLSGGTVEYNGTVVPGHFEFIDINSVPTSTGLNRADIKFVPDDISSFTGFDAKRCRYVTFTVSTTTPIYVDEINNPLIASEVEAGALLSTSILSGGKMTNPYNPEEPKILARTWEWTNPNTVVNESGYYEARFLPIGYTATTAQVYVKIAGEVPETTISEMPIIEPFLYDSSLTWKDITIKGGIAILKDEGTVVDGTFSVAESSINNTPSVGSYNVPVTFAPTDPEAALPYTFDVPVTVNKGQMKFVDESGNEIVPEITVEYGTTFGDIHYYLESYVAGDDAVSIGMVGIENANKTLCKDGTYTASLINRTDSNYERTELPFKIVIKRKTLTPKLTVAVGSDGLIIRDSSGNYSPKGTFTLEYTIDGVPQEPITGIKYETAFEFNYNKSGNYEYTIIYNEAEVDEYFIIDDFTTSNPIFLTWKFSATGSVDGEYKYGDEVKLEAPATDPAKEDKPFYGFVKWEDANGNTGLTEEELSNREISFAMPDGDVDLDATYKFDFCLCIRYYIQIVVDWFNSFFQSIGTLF